MSSSPSSRKSGKQAFQSPLQELSHLLDHLESQVSTTRQAHVESILNPPEKADSSKTGSFRRFFRRQETPKKGDDASTKASPNKEGGGSSEESQNSPSKTTELATWASDEPKAKFIDIPDSEAFVESLRRVAELVVVGENYVATQQRKEETAFERSKEQWNAQRDALDIGGYEELDGEESTETGKEDYLHFFDMFFERNTLELIINLLTGTTFQLTEEERNPSKDVEDSNGDVLETETPKKIVDSTTWLPHLEIATQALQSVSILIQNVSRNTSLYVILSNNRINELINLPLDLYLEAERQRQISSGREAQPMTFTSAEHSELTTHYVTFLKSLALRMNAETLQFYLKYPLEAAVAGDAMPVSPSHFSDHPVESLDSSSMASEQTEEANSSPVEHVKVEFPLYERALEFCAAHHDSFVRTTALNICLNTLRLSTISSPDDSFEEEAVQSFSLGSSPDGVLHNAKPLPFRERHAIAQFTCIPSRVEKLISPIFAKLAERWNSLDEQIREIDRNKDLSPAEGDDVSGSRNEKMEKAKEHVRRERLLRTFKDSAVDMQDEILLLEDVFKVGLTVLNEQMVEMMLATFVYPLLLQPLLLYYQRSDVLFGEKQHAFSYTSEHPLGGYSSDFSGAEKSLAPVAGPAKTALFTLASVFHFMSNRPLQRLLYTALLHPLSPDTTGAPTVRSTLEVATVCENGRKLIRLDSQAPSGDGERSTYPFGTKPGNRRVSKTKADLSEVAEGGEACVFVLAPALAEVLEFRGEDVALITRTKPNPYRSAILRCLDVPADMSPDVRGLAVCVLDAALTVVDGRFAADVLFGTDLKTFSDDVPADERNLESIYARTKDDRGIGGGVFGSRSSLDRRKGGQVGSDLTSEAVSALCRCVMIASKHRSSSSEWQLNYDEVAAHALLCSIRYSSRGMVIASKSMEYLWRQAAAFIAARPSTIHSPVGSSSSIPMKGSPSTNSADFDEQFLGAIMNFVFYDSMDIPDDTTPAMEEFVQLENSTTVTEGERQCNIAIATQSTFDTLCAQVGAFLLEEVEDVSMSLSDREEVQLTRLGAVSVFKLDALLSLVKDLAATGGLAFRDATLAGIAISGDGTIFDTKKAFVENLSKQIYAPLSAGTTKLMFGVNADGDMPALNSRISLAENPALPCVCEAPPPVASLFEGDGPGVIAEGVTWESLYLVFSHGYLVFAQPLSGDSDSSEARVIASCPLERLSVLQDEGARVDGAPPARRVLLFHKWFDRTPPPLFLFDALPEHEKFGPFFHAKPFTSSLDVWFEDEVAAGHAFRILAGQIFAAKAHRGDRIAKLLAPQIENIADS